MKKTSYLLPHSFQRIGWALLISLPVLLALVPWVFNDLKLIPQRYSRFGTMLVIIVAALSALFVGLSEEKQEDEFIQTLRMRSVANTAWICFILMILSAIVAEVFGAFRIQAGNGFFYSFRIFGSVVFAFFLYNAIFRIRLFRYRMEVRHDEK